MLDKVNIITKTYYISPQNLLNGFKKLNVKENMNIFQAVFNYIINTKRLT